MQDGFRWNIPARYNIGVDICDRIAASRPDDPAIIDVAADDQVTTTCFKQLKAHSNRLANVLSDVARVAVLLPQSLDTAVAHIAITKMR